MVIRNRQVPPIALPIITDVFFFFFFFFFFFGVCAGKLLPVGFGSAVIVGDPPEDKLGACVEVVVNLELPVDLEVPTRGNLRAKISGSSGSAQP